MKELCKKHLFSLEGIHYLNGAYMSPLSRKVEEAGMQGMRRKRIPTNLKPNHFFDHKEQIRERFQRLINAPSAEQVAILPSVSYGMAIVARNTDFRPGQNIVITGGQMPSNFYVWQRLCEEQGLELRIAPQPEEIRNRGDLWNEAILGLIDGATALVSLGHIHWLDGTLFDLAAIGRKVHGHGGVLIVDGTQSLGALPFDAAAIEPDAVIAAGYKCMMGPYALSVGYFGARYLNGKPLEETWINRMHSEDFPNLTNYQRQYRPGALRYDVGESSNFILAPMLAAALEQVLEWDVKVIANYCAGMTRRIAESVEEMGFQVIREKQRGPHYIGLGIPDGIDVQAFQQAFAARDVAVSARGRFLRVTPNIYNDDEDIDALLDVLQSFRSRRAAAAVG